MGVVVVSDPAEKISCIIDDKHDERNIFSTTLNAKMHIRVQLYIAKT